MDKIRLVETFDETPSISLIEGVTDNKKSSRVDGKYIIGMIEGQFFKPDGMSRNGRWYPRSLWTKALNRAETKNRLASSTMFGEIGHSDGPVEDMTLRQGCASHFIDDLWIDEAGRGMGRAYILNTPTGQLLKIYLGAGCKLKVSTRGEGNYKEGEFHNECPVVDDETYDFQTVDFVLNPGFLETSAVLKESYNKLTNDTKYDRKQIQETIAHVKKEGEKRMTLDIDAYVAELKEELKAVKAENKSLNEQLQAKNIELLQSQSNENAEIKKLNEAYAPFKKMGMSAEKLTENVKRVQNELKKVQTEKGKLNEELNFYKNECGSPEEVKSAIRLSTKSLKMIEEYRKIGTPEQFREAMETSKKLTEESKNSVNEMNEAQKALENSKKALTAMQETFCKSERLVKRYKALKESLAVKQKQLKESEKVLKLATKEIKTLRETAKLAQNLGKKYESVSAKNKELDKVANKAAKIIESYKAKYGELESMNESLTKPENVKKDALAISEKYGCSIESAAKLIRKNGVEKTTNLLESATKKLSKEGKGLVEGQKLVEEVAQLDKVTTIPAEKTAKDFLKDGMIRNYFNHEALGKEVVYKDLNDLDGTKNAGENKAKELLKKFGKKVEVEAAPKGLEKELTPAQAEAEAKKLLK